MKSLRLTLALSALLATSALTLHTPPAQATSLSLSGDHLRWADHHDPASGRLAITTEDGKVTMLLTDRVVAVQLSERTIHKVRRELRDKKDDQDNVLGMAIASAVIGAVRELIDSSFELPLRELKDVSYEGGSLRFTGRNGKPVFDDAELCDTDVMSSFSERDAREFVREFRRVKGRD